VDTEPPVVDPLADLHPTARRIVDTTRRLLIERGYGSLSLETIADECGLNKTAIRYYFRNKAGLMELVVDSWVHDNMARMQPLADRPEKQKRLDAFAQRKKEMSEDREHYLAQFELLAPVLRDERHSERMAELYDWAIEVYARFFAPDLEGLSPRQVRGFCQMLCAFVDGLGVQQVMDPEKFGVDEPYEMIEEILTAWIDRRREKS
jgi:AcrR family transcriptional regulator